MKNKPLIINDLKKTKLYNKSNLHLIQNFTRNGKVNVLKDKKNNFFFLDKILTNKNNYYEKKYHKIHTDGDLWHGNFYGKKIRSPKVDENQKRVKLYKKFIYKKKILDFGCGFGNFVIESCKYSKKTYAFEKSEICKNHIKKKFKKVEVLDNLTDFDNFFDTIFLIQTLHYLPQQINELLFLRKKLKKNGKIIIEVPSSNDILLSKFNLQEFKNFTFCIESLIWHNNKSLMKFLKKAGFKKIKINPVQRYDLNNHMGWLLFGKPGGHEFLRSFCNNKQKKIYENYLKKNQLTDTLVAIAKK